MSYRLETLWVVLGGACLVALYARAEWPRWQRVLLVGGAALAVLVSLLSYFDDWRGKPPSAWLHEHDFFHYYFGAKYFPVVGYMRLYVCTSAALRERAEAGRRASPISFVRRLEAPDATLSGAALLRAESDCRRHFSDARWQSFMGDLATMEQRLASPADWQGTVADLGNNSPPTWNLYAAGLANALPLNALVLSYWPLVDQLLLFVLVPWVVWRTFGALGLLSYGLVYCASPLAFLGWIGGSFGRADWYVALVCGLCALKTRRVTLAAALLAMASACRVFPLLFMAAAPLAMFAHARRAEALRFVLVAGAVLALLVGASTLGFGGAVWSEFAQVLSLRITPYGANTLGLHKLAACWNVIAWPQFAGGDEALRDATAWLETLAGDAARRAGVSIAVGLSLLGASLLLLRGRTVTFSAIWGGLMLLYVLLTPFTYYYAVFALLPLAITELEGRARAALFALLVLGLAALRAVSVPFSAELGVSTGFYAVSVLSSRVLLMTYAAMLLALALVEVHAARRGARAALASALLALVLAAWGYRAAPAATAHFVSLAKLGSLTVSQAVTVRERPATASWPDSRFYEIHLRDAQQQFAVKLDGVAAGRYRVSVETTAAPGYGRVRVAMAEREMTIDGRRDDGRALPQRVTLGTLVVGGNTRLTVQALDAGGARIGLSGLVLEPPSGS